MSASGSYFAGVNPTSPKVTFADPVVSGSSYAYTSSTISTDSTFSTTSPVASLCSSPIAELAPPAVNEVDLPTGVVDMDAFSQILALDEDDATREFSKALVWAWCEQAELAVEEMDSALSHADAAAAANKAQYLKGSSASLGLVKVADSCQSIHYLHFPASLAHYRSHIKFPSVSGGSGSGMLSPESQDSRSSSSSGSSGSSNSTVLSPNRYSPDSSFGGTPDVESDKSPSPPLSGSVPVRPSMHGSAVHRYSAALAGLKSSHPAIPNTPTDFEALKIQRAKGLVQRLKVEITEASEWLYSFYQGADRYAESMEVDHA